MLENILHQDVAKCSVGHDMQQGLDLNVIQYKFSIRKKRKIKALLQEIMDGSNKKGRPCKEMVQMV